MEQLLCHLIGDYLLQNDWMALNKKESTTKGIFICALHCLIYTLPFLFITQDVFQLSLIWCTHFLIDSSYLVDRFIAFKNGANWKVNFGFSEKRPIYLTIWLYIITDNLFHLLSNYLILKYV